MKLITTLAILVGTSYAQTGFISEDQLRGLSKEWVLSVYVSMIQHTSESVFEKNYVKALKARADYAAEHGENIPVHVYEAIINRMMFGAGSVDRSVNCPAGQCTIPIELENLWNYGCWCNFGEDIGKGAGIPVNEYDEICRDMQKCIRCAQVDGDGAGGACDIYQVSYNTSFTMSSGFGLTANCETNNNNYCSEHMCSCEMNLLSKLMDILWAGVFHDHNYHHNNGFDWDANCPTTNPNNNNNNNGNSGNNVGGGGNNPGNGGPSTPPSTCCGYYPDRAHMSTTEACCLSTNNPPGVNLAYNPITHLCCNDGDYVAEGSC